MKKILKIILIVVFVFSFESLIAQEFNFPESEFQILTTGTGTLCYGTITGVPELICDINTVITLGVSGNAVPIGTGVGFNFPFGFLGIGVQGSTFDPSISGAGEFEITYKHQNANCADIKKTVKVGIRPPYLDRVISASANTFSDNWPIDFASNNSNGLVVSLLTNLDPFYSGSKGIWRTDESYVYVKNRQLYGSSDIPTVPGVLDISEDGIYNDMPMFDWTIDMANTCSDPWRLVNTITRYNTSNFETENKDILNNRSTALYGYKGDLTTAVASNAAYYEVAFESFEEYSSGSNVNPKLVSSSNLSIFTSIPSVSDFKPLFRELEVIDGTDNQFKVIIPSGVDLSGKLIKVMGANYMQPDINGNIVTSLNKKNIYGSFNVSNVTNSVDPNLPSTITLNSSEFLFTGKWKGKIYVPIPMVSPIVSGTSTSISNVKAHTGKNSVAIRGNAYFQQERLFLEAEKYVVSCWMSTTNAAQTTFKVSDSDPNKRGLSFEFKDKNGASLGSTPVLEPSGSVIEGWQKVEGIFNVPIGTTKVILKIYAPNSSSTDYTYIDDIRIFPADANMQSYVYDKQNLKLQAVLDNNNYATLYYYDQSGNLFLVKKETEKGIYTIQESFSHTAH